MQSFAGTPGPLQSDGDQVGVGGLSRSVTTTGEPALGLAWPIVNPMSWRKHRLCISSGFCRTPLGHSLNNAPQIVQHGQRQGQLCVGGLQRNGGRQMRQAQSLSSSENESWEALETIQGPDGYGANTDKWIKVEQEYMVANEVHIRAINQ